MLTPVSQSGSTASCGECVVHISAAALNTQRAQKQQLHICELLHRVGTCLNCVVEAAAEANAHRTVPHSESEQEAAALGQSARFACVSTEVLWRTWRATPEATTLFHRSGFSSAFSAFEKSVSRAVVQATVPQLQRTQQKVQQVNASVQRASQRVLQEQEECSAREQWVLEAVKVLAHATHAPTAELWTALEADYTALGAGENCGGGSALTHSSDAAKYGGRLAQQQQRILQLLRDVRGVITNDASPDDKGHDG